MSIQAGLLGFGVTLTDEIIWAVTGLLAGFLSSHAVFGRGQGFLVDTVIGLVGGVLGTVLANLFGIFPGSSVPYMDRVLVAFIGAILVLLVVRVVADRKAT